MESVAAVQGLEALRRQALEALEKLPWQPIADSPTVKSYTDWRLFERALGAPVARLEEPPAGWRTGRSLCSLPEAEGPVLTSPSESRLLAAHYSRLSAAPRLLRLSGGVEAVSLCAWSSGAWASQHLVVETEPGTSSELLLLAPPGGHGTAVVEVVMGEASSLRLGVVARPGPGAAYALVLRSRVPRAARLYTAVLGRGAGQARIEELHLLTGEEASLDARSLSIARGEERVDHILDTVQDAPRSRAVARVDGVALDKALAVARGTATVRESARRSSSLFEANVLILGEEARGYTAPMMRIDTGDVEAATHHAAQHRIPAETLYYLATRGLGAGEAAQLILHGYLERLAEQLLEAREGFWEKALEAVAP